MGQEANKKDKPTVLGEKIKNISTDATAVETKVLQGETFYATGQKKTGSMANREAWTNRLGINSKIVIPQGYHNGQGYIDQAIPTKGAQIYTPSIASQVINAGQYLSGAQTISGDPNLVPGNIRKGKTIFGITGTYNNPESPIYLVKDGYFTSSFSSVTKHKSSPDLVVIENQYSTNILRIYTTQSADAHTIYGGIFAAPIELTNYNLINFANVSTMVTCDNVTIGVIDSNTFMNSDSYSLLTGNKWLSRYWTSDISNRDFSINVSALSGSYYIGFMYRPKSDSGSYPGIQFKNIFLALD